MSENVVKLHQEKPCNDVAATLRRIADEIEAQTEWPVTTCVVLTGHTNSEVPGPDGTMMQENFWHTYGAGPRCDTYTAAG